VGENPVPAADAIQVMELIELGLESAKQQRALPVA
jgi:predicted dehydrogenase